MLQPCDSQLDLQATLVADGLVPFVDDRGVHATQVLRRVLADELSRVSIRLSDSGVITSLVHGCHLPVTSQGPANDNGRVTFLPERQFVREQHMGIASGRNSAVTSRLALGLAFSLSLWAGAASAFVVNPVGGGDYTKWGPSNASGTPGGVVTWGFMAADTPGSSFCGDACTGASTLSLPNFYATPGTSNTVSSLSMLSLQSVFQAALDQWSAVANVQFQYVGIDSSLRAINDPAAIAPMIRIGAFAFSGSAAFSGAVGYSPPPNGGTGAGDLLLNTGVGFQLASGAEGSALQQFPLGGGFYMNDLNGLILHELGHTLGLGHSTDITTVMCGSPTANCANLGTVTQRLKADDIAGASFLYGAAAPVPEPSRLAMMLLGAGLLGGQRLRKRRA
jgi:hypothetical protein